MKEEICNLIFKKDFNKAKELPDSNYNEIYITIKKNLMNNILWKIKIFGT
ncbi:hypothetical protein J2X31_002166 [Flavobacterium arsenatis]|uniref:Uncharacterized protein n=1 Tax=Flavobacterium arsenatis TaxID=1484332 RepID=A0ABU1TQB9_9FLAO|nr:hypothetical protein [Flavobacterium arsenatis]MDR6968151.1 hypothetical protein [Flavobacterium arsenatis]